MVEVGVFVMPDARDPDHTVRQAVAADEAGLDLVAIQDRPYRRRFFAPELVPRNEKTDQWLVGSRLKLGVPQSALGKISKTSCPPPSPPASRPKKADMMRQHEPLFFPFAE